jgi:hypothetical protein
MTYQLPVLGFLIGCLLSSLSNKYFSRCGTELQFALDFLSWSAATRLFGAPFVHEHEWVKPLFAAIIQGLVLLLIVWGADSLLRKREAGIRVRVAGLVCLIVVFEVLVLFAFPMHDCF